MNGETSFPEFLDVLKRIAEELTALRAISNRIAEALEEANRLEGNHPSRI